MSELPGSVDGLRANVDALRANPRSPLNLPIRVASYREGLPADQLQFSMRESRDLSVGGLSYFVSTPPTNAQIVVVLPGPRYVLAHIRNVERVGDGRYAVGCQFIRQIN